MTEISREEIHSLVESNTKVSMALQLIAERLDTCSDNLIKVLETLAMRQKQFDTIDATKIIVDKIKEDTFWQKIIFGSIAFITSIGVMIQVIIHKITQAGIK